MMHKDTLDRMQRRAELFTFIAELVKTCDDQPTPQEQWPQEQWPQEHFSPEVRVPVLRLGELLPRIAVVDGRVLCNGAELDLSKRPLSLRLFESFCRAGDYQVTRDDLVHHVYQLKVAEHSGRFLDSAHNNAVKLISRARIMAANTLGRAVGDGVEWFVYDQERRIWSLYRLRTQYLTARLG